jgi:hypothetical protein
MIVLSKGAFRRSGQWQEVTSLLHCDDRLGELAR